MRLLCEIIKIDVLQETQVVFCVAHTHSNQEISVVVNYDHIIHFRWSFLWCKVTLWRWCRLLKEDDNYYQSGGTSTTAHQFTQYTHSQRATADMSGRVNFFELSDREQNKWPRLGGSSLTL